MKVTALVGPVLTLLAMTAVACGLPPSTSAANGPFPARPYSLDTARIDPCTGLTSQQRRALSVQTARHDEGPFGPRCIWLDGKGRSFTLSVFDGGATAALERGRNPLLTTAAGFGAVRFTPPEAQGKNGVNCQFVIDVADASALAVGLDVNNLMARPVTTEQACTEVEARARDILETLHAQQS
ncbi:DUF3558 family protein [Pseudonocardia phyllosphaerae]|uniref:DUF3558 family protein n=1 Tax=Pseudonocardia phyllosphaerae TaxID=3390502 RepID=UPI00397A480B